MTLNKKLSQKVFIVMVLAVAFSLNYINKYRFCLYLDNCQILNPEKNH